MFLDRFYFNVTLRAYHFHTNFIIILTTLISIALLILFCLLFTISIRYNFAFVVDRLMSIKRFDFF
jgi:hypothetical protein